MATTADESLFAASSQESSDSGADDDVAVAAAPVGAPARGSAAAAAAAPDDDILGWGPSPSDDEHYDDGVDVDDAAPVGDHVGDGRPDYDADHHHLHAGAADSDHSLAEGDGDGDYGDDEDEYDYDDGDDGDASYGDEAAAPRYDFGRPLSLGEVVEVTVPIKLRGNFAAGVSHRIPERAWSTARVLQVQRDAEGNIVSEQYVPARPGQEVDVSQLGHVVPVGASIVSIGRNNCDEEVLLDIPGMKNASGGGISSDGDTASVVLMPGESGPGGDDCVMVGDPALAQPRAYASEHELRSSLKRDPEDVQCVSVPGSSPIAAYCAVHPDDVGLELDARTAAQMIAGAPDVHFSIPSASVERAVRALSDDHRRSLSTRISARDYTVRARYAGSPAADSDAAAPGGAPVAAGHTLPYGLQTIGAHPSLHSAFHAVSAAEIEHGPVKLGAPVAPSSAAGAGTVAAADDARDLHFKLRLRLASVQQDA